MDAADADAGPASLDDNGSGADGSGAGGGDDDGNEDDDDEGEEEDDDDDVDYGSGSGSERARESDSEDDGPGRGSPGHWRDTQRAGRDLRGARVQAAQERSALFGFEPTGAAAGADAGARGDALPWLSPPTVRGGAPAGAGGWVTKEFGGATPRWARGPGRKGHVRASPSLPATWRRWRTPKC